MIRGAKEKKTWNKKEGKYQNGDEIMCQNNVADGLLTCHLISEHCIPHENLFLLPSKWKEFQ